VHAAIAVGPHRDDAGRRIPAPEPVGVIHRGTSYPMRAANRLAVTSARALASTLACVVAPLEVTA
jgi:hypothetical protein